MANPISVDLPHRLGAAEAKRRIATRIGRLGDYIPGGGQVESSWETEQRMKLRVAAMGQEVNAAIDVEESVVRLTVELPAFLSFFGKKVEAIIRREGAALLEDRSAPKA